MSWTLDPRYVPANVKWAKKAPTHLGDTIAALQGRPRDVSTLTARPTTLSERIASRIVPDGRKWTDLRNKVSGAVDALTPLGAEQPLRDARSAYQGGNKWGAAGLGALAMLGAVPGVGTEAKAGTKAAKGIFGKRAAAFDLGKSGYNVAKVGDTTVEYSVGPSGVEVSKVFTPPEARGQGSARAAMQSIIEAADRKGLQLNLTPDPLDAATSKTKLQGFYSSLGFVPNKGRNKDFGTRAAMLRTPQQPQGIIAYHGSPHSFDKFSLDKIGTGEGAQAYGHGLYFAENEDVARAYRDSLSGKPANPLDRRDVQAAWVAAARSMRDAGYDETRSLAALKSAYPKAPDEHLRTAFVMSDPGSMYQVRINANPEDFLDWDKPLRDQPQAMKALNELDLSGMPQGGRARTMLEWAKQGTEQEHNLANGSHLANAARGWGEANPAGTEFLRGQGIPGIKYLDQGSRGAGDGSRNYVVFDDALIEILKKYGIAVPAMGLGIAGMSRQPEGGM